MQTTGLETWPSSRISSSLKVKFGTQSPEDRSLNVTDVLSYMNAVKVTYQDKPEVYDRFFEIMRDFKSQMCVVVSFDSGVLIYLILSIDTPGLIQRVLRLFHGNTSLIEGLNLFLPVGYHIDVSATDPKVQSLITITTPQRVTIQKANKTGISRMQVPSDHLGLYPLKLPHTLGVPLHPVRPPPHGFDSMTSQPYQFSHVPPQLNPFLDTSIYVPDPLLNASSRSKRKRATMKWFPLKAIKLTDENQGDEVGLNLLRQSSRTYSKSRLF